MDQLSTEAGNRRSLVGSRLQLFENICADQNDSKPQRVVSVRSKISRSNSNADDDSKPGVNMCVNINSVNDTIDLNVINVSDESDSANRDCVIRSTKVDLREDDSGTEDQFDDDIRAPNLKYLPLQNDSSFNKRISYNMAVSGREFGIFKDTESDSPILELDSERERATVNGNVEFEDERVVSDASNGDRALIDSSPSAVKDDVEDLSSTKVSECNLSVISSSPSIDNCEINDTNGENCRNDVKSKDENYPEELNPFGDDDEDVVVEKEEGSNPFDSDDAKNESKVSTNPFWSGSEEEDEEETAKVVQKTPVPLPRTVKKPIAYISPQPSPKPRVKSNQSLSPTASCHSLQFAGRKSSGGSLDVSFQRTPESHSVNSTLRKKKPAPPPPPPVDEKFKDNKNDNQTHTNEQINKVEAVAADQSNKIKISPWRNKKGPAPARPIPIRRPVKEMPLEDIKTEISDIEIRQQELERQGNQLKEMIGDTTTTDPNCAEESSNEELILQLFELVNEKNELLRRRTELMYMRKMHNLEEEHADIEYQLRCLMLRPESNKTDSDKTKEDELLNRLLEVVEKKNEIVEAMDKDRQRETAEDRSVTTQLDEKKSENEDKPSKKGKKVKKDKLKEDEACKSPDGKHSPSKIIKQKFMTLRHSAKKLNSKIPH